MRKYYSILVKVKIKKYDFIDRRRDINVYNIRIFKLQIYMTIQNRLLDKIYESSQTHLLLWNSTMQFSRRCSTSWESKKEERVELIGKLPLKCFVCPMEIAGYAIKLL